MSDEIHQCSLCGEHFVGWGNNPEPLKRYDEGVCCGLCNDLKVIPARLAQMRQRYENPS